MLVQEVAAKYPGQVTFVSETFGASKLAEKFGVKGYPAVFVDDVLVAAPREFGFFGETEGSGRYAPWRSADNQEKFKNDLNRMISLILSGRKDAIKTDIAPTREIESLPKLHLTDLNGAPLDSTQLAGRPVLVEFWATWCPPCRSTLEYLGELKRKYGDNLAIVALAVESPEDGVRQMADSLSGEIHWAIGDAPTAQSFGDITAVPTMFLFDKSGKTAKVIFGAPPDLHQDIAAILSKLIGEPRP